MRKQAVTPQVPYRLLLVVGLGIAFGLSLAFNFRAGRAPAADQISALQNLVDQSGAAFDPITLRGRTTLVYFGFTQCPDACPTALFSMMTAIKDLDATGARIQPVFVTVDPQRDTAAVLAEYLKHFGAELIGLTGSSGAIGDTEKALGVIAVQHRDAKFPDGYSMDHSNELLLFSSQGKLIRRIDASLDAVRLANQLREALDIPVSRSACGPLTPSDGEKRTYDLAGVAFKRLS